MGRATNSLVVDKATSTYRMEGLRHQRRFI